MTHKPSNYEEAMAEIDRLNKVYDQKVGEKERYRLALQEFANPANWSVRAGFLQWTAKRSAVEYAMSILRGE